MIDPIVFWTFIPAALALNLTPGADMMFCLGQGLRSGRSAAVAASGGMAVAGMVQVLLAGLGLGAVVAALPWMLEALRWIGVGYLLYLAVVAFRGSVQAEATARPAGNAFRAGFVVNLTNPKYILFVLAFLPQFIDESRAVLPQFLLLGAVMSLGGFFINGGVGMFASGAGRRLISNPSATRWLERLSGGVFALLALRLAVIERA